MSSKRNFNKHIICVKNIKETPSQSVAGGNVDTSPYKMHSV